jgi:hypothetical protein
MRVNLQLNRTLAAGGFIALLVGCRGDVVAPSATQSAMPTASYTGFVINSSFVYNPQVASTHYLGGHHRISFAAGAVCDPAVSTYGPTEWDQPCTPLRTPITITSRASWDAAGRPRVDFTPALRFVPGSEVVLYLRDKAAASDSTAVIEWCDDAGACAPEAATQPSYETKRDQALGIVYRSIKHFSGYLISIGRVGLSVQ